MEYNGNQRKGEYPGWDRFGRPVAQRWIDGDGFERSSISSDAWPPIPQLVELAVAKSADTRPDGAIDQLIHPSAMTR